MCDEELRLLTIMGRKDPFLPANRRGLAHRVQGPYRQRWLLQDHIVVQRGWPYKTNGLHRFNGALVEHSVTKIVRSMPRR